jgi:hypothetical protein
LSFCGDEGLECNFTFIMFEVYCELFFAHFIKQKDEDMAGYKRL